MLELFAIAVLALYGVACTAILVFALWRSSCHRDARLAELEALAEASDALTPPTPALPFLHAYPADEIFPIMAEHFPVAYDRYRNGTLDEAARREAWEACCAIHDARVEIEELCS